MEAEPAGPLIIGLTVMFEVIAIIAVSLRFWAQRSLKRNISAHDVWIIVGLVKLSRLKVSIAGVLIMMQICATALSISLILSVVMGGLGQHAIDLYATPWKIVIFQKVSLDRGSVSQTYWKWARVVWLILCTASHDCSNLLGLRHDKHQDVYPFLVHPSFSSTQNISHCMLRHAASQYALVCWRYVCHLVDLSASRQQLGYIDQRALRKLTSCVSRGTREQFGG